MRPLHEVFYELKGRLEAATDKELADHNGELTELTTMIGQAHMRLAKKAKEARKKQP